MPTLYIVVVTSGANALDDKGLYSLYHGKSFNSICGRHLDCEMLETGEMMKVRKQYGYSAR